MKEQANDKKSDIKEPSKEIFKISTVTQTYKSNTLNQILEKNKDLNNKYDYISLKCTKLKEEIITHKEEIVYLHKQNKQLTIDHKEYDNFRLSMSCIDILNKALLFFVLFYMLTATSHSATKLINTGFSFFDWIVLFLCVIQFYCKIL